MRWSSATRGSRPAGYRIGNDGLEYLDAGDGDGRVPLQSALLPGVRTWRCDAEHGKLPETDEAFDAYVELLESGDTRRLARLEGGVRGAADAPQALEAQPAVARAPAVAAAVARRPTCSHARPAPPPMRARPKLALRVLNGEPQVRQPAAAARPLRRRTLSGTEAVVDRLLGGAMHAALAAGALPVGAGRAPGVREHARRSRAALVTCRARRRRWWSASAKKASCARARCAMRCARVCSRMRSASAEKRRHRLRAGQHRCSAAAAAACRSAAPRRPSRRASPKPTSACARSAGRW